MTYRDDHEAALERADALESELAVERDKHERDEERIKALEAELAKRPPLPEPEPPKIETPKHRTSAVEPPPDPPVPKPWIKWLAGGAIAAIAVVGAIIFFVMRHNAKWAEVDDGWVVQAYLDEATAEANNRIPGGATISKILAVYVNESGRAQLTMNRSGTLYFYFGSATDPSACLEASVSRNSTALSYTKSTQCDPVIPGPLRCSISALFVRAMQSGMSSASLVTIRLESSYGKRGWEVVPEGGKYRFDDDCP